MSASYAENEENPLQDPDAILRSTPALNVLLSRIAFRTTFSVTHIFLLKN